MEVRSFDQTASKTLVRTQRRFDGDTVEYLSK